MSPTRAATPSRGDRPEQSMVFQIARGVLSREDGSLDLAERNLDAVALARAADDDRVAVGKERAFLATVQPDGVAPAPRQLDEAPVRPRLGARDRAGREQVAGAHRGSVDC